MEEDGRLVQFIYNHRGEVITEESGEAGLTRYIRGLGIVSSDSEQAKTYYHYVCDYAGSTSHVLNEQGNVENEYLYDAFGNITASAENVPNRFCYTGEQYDRIPNQYYLRARYYNPVIGRFTQQDTYLGAGLNLYAYCGGNPLSYVDPSGHTQQSAGDNAENNYGCIQTPEPLQQPSVQAWIQSYVNAGMNYSQKGADSGNNFSQKGVDAMTNNVYGNDGTSGVPAQSAGMLSDINSGPKSTALMVIDPPGSLVPALYKPFDYSTMGSHGGDTNQTTALAPVAPFGSYEIVPFRNDTGTNPLDAAQSSAVAAAISDAGGGGSGSGSGVVEYMAPPDATPAQIAQVKAYVDGCNEALKAGKLSNTGRVSTKGSLRRQASRAARKEAQRAAQAGTPYTGHVGHVPDTTWTNTAEPFAWLDLDPTVNTSLGGQANRYPIGYKPTAFVFKEDN